MAKRKIDFEVVPERDYTDFSDRMEGKYAMSNKAMIGTSVSTAAAITAYGIHTIKSVPAYVTAPTTLPELAPTLTPIVEPLNVLAQDPSILHTIPVNFNGTMTPEMIPTGFIADSSLNMLANVLDPLVQILVAISFPIASVIMVGACFFFMLGNSEKAWSSIFNAGLGYVLVQMSPLFLAILREIGKAV